MHRGILYISSRVLHVGIVFKPPADALILTSVMANTEVIPKFIMLPVQSPPFLTVYTCVVCSRMTYLRLPQMGAFFL